MNANELIEELEDTGSFFEDALYLKSAALLRQQQAEIEKLKAEVVAIENNADYWADKANWIKNNKPVAWTDGRGNYFDKNSFFPVYDLTPLYTHPVKEQYKFGADWSKDGNAVTVLKICEDGVAEVVFMDYQEVTHPAELTDEEILQVMINVYSDTVPPIRGVEFARAILRKAQNEQK